MKCDTVEQMDAFARDSSYHDIGTLPSQGLPYKGRMDKLFIRPFRLSEMRLLSKAVQLQELGPLIRAVDSVISHDVYDLTIGDFYYILLWLRMYSMPESPYVIQWHCNQPYFVHKETKQALVYSDKNWPSVEDLQKDYDVSTCDSDNTSVVNQSTVDIVCLEEDFQLDPRLDYPRVRILEDLNAALLDSESSMLAPAIQWMIGDTWAEKVAAAEADTSLDLFATAMKVNRTVVHGVNETIVFSCYKCRVEHSEVLKLNALTFFP